mmetsp:Transcript_6763/g.15430  ORF Transcript_6763/g.15430 Transcript_6763/m.15430 type:complete len:225 (-) Transcript_6763:515-1189(-)
MIRNKFVCSPTLRSQCIHSFIHSFNKPKRLVAEHALLMLVHCSKSRGGAGGRRSARVQHLVLAYQSSLHARLDAWHRIPVRAHVKRLLLAEHNLSIGVSAKLAAHEVEGEGCKLLDATNSNLALVRIVRVLKLLFAKCGKVVVNFARAEDQPLDVVKLRQRIWTLVKHPVVHDQPAKARSLQLVRIVLVIKLQQWAHALGMTQQALGREHDERLAELAVHLPTQ